MSLPTEPVKQPAKLEPLPNMATVQKLETMELNNLHTLGSTTLLPPVPPATTPTIRLSVPRRGHSPHHGVDIVTSDHELGGISNAGFLSDGAVTPLTQENVPTSEQSSLSHLSSDRDGFLSASSPSPSMADSVFSSSGDLHLVSKAANLSGGLRPLTLSMTDSLGPPHPVDVQTKRFSLPGSMDHLSPTSARMPKSPDPSTGANNSHSLQNTDDALHSQLTSPGSRSSSWGMGRWFQKRPSAVSSMSSMSDISCMSNSMDEESVAANTRQKLQSLVKTVTQRAKKMGHNEVTPVSTVSATLAPPVITSVRKRLDSFAPSSGTDIANEIRVKKFGCCSVSTLRNLAGKFTFPSSIDSTGRMWLAWLWLVAMVYIYNAIAIFLRASFEEVTIGPETSWLYFDYLGDFIYFLDIILHMRVLYYDNGQIVNDKVLMRKHYTVDVQFKYDVICLLPLDLFYFLVGIKPILRLPRLLKTHSYSDFVEKFENKSNSANAFRVVKTAGYLLYMIHLNTCCYYVVSVWEGISSNSWVYNGKGNAYIRCLYRATKTLITIGNLPTPVTTFEIVFMNMDFIIGVFVFATIIGQMRDIVGAAGAAKGSFRRRMDNTMSLLQIWKIPNSVQRRVRLWFMYSWDRRELLDEKEIMKNVPIKMQTDIAIHVHMDTLSKVSLFQDCDKMLLRDLVLKLRPVLFLPGDFICRKGEVGKEMYIIKNGIVQVLGGLNNRNVLATLHPGSYFGEISLLSVGSGNRRTADVYSPGYANLFILEKRDLQEVIINYPNAQESLKKKAREILRKNQATDGKPQKRRGKSLIAESLLVRHQDSEKSFFNAVLGVARTSKIANTILRGSYRSGMDEIEDELAHYSKSDISSDEIIFGNKAQRKRRKKLVKRAKKHQPDHHSNDDSESQNEQGRSETEREAPPKRLSRRTASVTSPNVRDLRPAKIPSEGRSPRESIGGNNNLLWDKEVERSSPGRPSMTDSIPLEEEEQEEAKTSREARLKKKADSKSSFSGINERHLLARSISDVEKEDKRSMWREENDAVCPDMMDAGQQQRPSTVQSTSKDNGDPDAVGHAPKLSKADTVESYHSSDVDSDGGLSSDGSSATLSGSDDCSSKASNAQEGYDSSNESSPSSKN